MSVHGKPEEDVESLGAGVMSNCEPSDMGVGTKLGASGRTESIPNQ